MHKKCIPLSLSQNLFEVFLRSFFYKKSDRGQGREALVAVRRRRNSLLPSKNAGVGEFSAH